jgi:chromosome segregation ATPase
MADEQQPEGIREKLSRQGEEALGRLVEELVGNPVFNSALSRAMDARDKASQAQEAAMGALGIPSAADVERVTRRLRSVSQRLEGIEDGVDRLDARLEQLSQAAAGSPGDARFENFEGRLDKLEARLEEIAHDISALREALVPGQEPPPRAQERLTVSEGG